MNRTYSRQSLLGIHRLYHCLCGFFLFFLCEKNFGTLRAKGWPEWAFPEVAAVSFWPPTFPRVLSLLPPRCGKGKRWVFWGRKLLRAGCCHFQNNSFAPDLGLKLPSSSPGKEVTKSKVTDKMSGPSRLSQVMYCGLGEKLWHQSTDGWKRQTHRSLAVSHPKPFKDSSTPKYFSLKSLKLHLKDIPWSSHKKYEIMLLTYCQIFSLIQRAVLFSKEEQIRLKYI